MNKATGEAIGKEMGDFLSMDKDEDNTDGSRVVPKDQGKD
jgi:hypothetical protein